MKIYNLIHDSRHCEPTAATYTDPSQAIAAARATVKDYAYSPEDIEETDIPGWLFHVEYSCDGGALWVIESTLIEPGGEK